MFVRFLGVGEAWDCRHPNVSMLVDDGKTSLLLECGVSSQYPMIRFLEEEKRDLDYLDGIFISHLHFDHAEGVAGVLAIMSAFDHAPGLKPRKKPLAIMLPKGGKKILIDCINSHHPGLIEKLGYGLKFIEVSPGDEMGFKTLKLRFAESRHSRMTLAVRIESGGKSLAYSGDGAPTEDSMRLYDGVDLLVHEAYSIGGSKAIAHGTVINLLDKVKKIDVNKLAFVHINRHERKNRMKEILETIEKSGLKDKVFIPEDGDKINI